jgi:hypothetical protein
MFVLYPKVTNVAFEGFPCCARCHDSNARHYSALSDLSLAAPRLCRAVWFEAVGDAPKRGWLRADVSIECNTPEHARITQLAWAAVVMYPIGMWLFTLALLRSASTAIFSGKTTPFSRSVAFLYAGYEVPTFWWELMEMLRKFLLVGYFVTVEPGTTLQIAMGTVVSAAYFVRAPLRDGVLPVPWPCRCTLVQVPLDPSHLARTDDTVEGSALQEPHRVRSCVSARCCEHLAHPEVHGSSLVRAATRWHKQRAGACSCSSSAA